MENSSNYEERKHSDASSAPTGEHIHLHKKLSGQDYAVIETSNDALVTKV